MKQLAYFAVAAVFLTGTAHAQYKQCAPEWMAQGRQIVAEACGTLNPAAPQAEVTSEADLAAQFESKDALNARMAEYSACVNTFINTGMRNNIDIELLDYATCADQWAQEQRTEARVNVGLACIAWEDRTRQSFSQPCFPPAG
jgi:hypothetical protein